jgi:hypothetical protein
MASDTTILGLGLSAPVVGVASTVAYTGASAALMMVAVAGAALVLFGLIVIRIAMFRKGFGSGAFEHARADPTNLGPPGLGSSGLASGYTSSFGPPSAALPGRFLATKRLKQDTHD